MNTLLHIHASESGDIWHGIYKEVLLSGILDTLKLLPFLFLTYLLMELIEHKATEKTFRFMYRSGKFGPLAGGLLGVVPQCGFSAAAANFYTGRVITLGMLISVFLSTSDEMLPLMISGKVPAKAIFAILAYKAAVGILVGFILDFILRLIKREREEINIDRLCEEGGCKCERGIFISALHHTATVGFFILIVTLVINLIVFFVGADNISKIQSGIPVISHLIAAVIGLIPNCISSVMLTDFCLSGFISVGTMLSGLFSGAGVGILILFKVNKNLKENLTVMGILVLAGTFFGFLADVLNFSSLI